MNRPPRKLRDGSRQYCAICPVCRRAVRESNTPVFRRPSSVVRPTAYRSEAKLRSGWYADGNAVASPANASAMARD